MGKSFTIEDRIPPILPINWLDWEGDEHVQEMDETMEGIYFRIVRELWKFNQFEFNYTQLAKRLRVKDARRVRSFLEKWGHLFRCVKCGLVPVPRWEHAATLQQPCSDLAVPMQKPCRYCAASLQCSCSDLAVFVQHGKLKNYKNDVISGSPLGTTQQNQTKPNRTETEHTAAAAAVALLVPSAQAGSTENEPEEQPVPASSTSPTSAPSVPPAAVAPATALNDIREWSEPRFGVSGDRLRNCVLYQLDHAKNDYYRDSGISVASMNREKFVTKLHAETPPGWTPESVTKKTTVAVTETDAQREEREYYERIDQLKADGHDFGFGVAGGIQ